MSSCVRQAERPPGRASSYLLGARAGVQGGLPIDDPRWREPAADMAQMPTGRMGPPPGASPPMRMTASWFGSAWDPPNTSVWRDVPRPMASSPRIITQTFNGRRQTPELRREAHLAVHRPSACSGVKALRNTSDAKAASRQAVLAFRSLDPFRALREPDRRRRDEERPFPLRTKNCEQNPKNNQRIDCLATGGKAP